MQSIPVPYYDTEPNSEETTMVSFCQDPDGRFTGALMPMRNPIDTDLQWQSLLAGLIVNAIGIDPQANLDGIYTFSWWADHKEPEHSGMLFTRLSDEAEKDSLEDYRLPVETIALLSLSTKKKSTEAVGVLAVSGYVSTDTSKLRGDRIFGTVISMEDHSVKPVIDQESKKEMLAIGDSLNLRLNSNLLLRQDI